MNTTICDKFYFSLRTLLNNLLQKREYDPTYKILATQEALTLEVLGTNEPLSMSELARLSGMLANTMTGIIDRLVRRRIVRRESRPEDRRFVLVRLTEYGRKLYQQQQDFAHSATTNLLKRLSNNEQDQLVELLEKMLLPTQD